jgi:CheY-like chemotaxis protein
MPKTLLLADDSVTIQKVVGIVFATEDYRVVPVDNGEDALRKARELRPDIVLADAVMPRMNGYELCQAVKADPQLADVPVLLLAGTFEPFDEARARAARADGHIAKPFDSQSLLSRVRELVEGITVEPMPLPYPKAAPAAVSPPAAPRLTPPPAPRRAVPPPFPPPGHPARAGAPRPGGLPMPSVKTAGIRPPPPPPVAARPAVTRPPAFPPPASPARAPAPPPRPFAPTPARTALPPRPPPPSPFGLAPPVAAADDDWSDVSAPAAPAATRPAPVAPMGAAADGGEAALRVALSQASREVVERIAWEVIPQLAEVIIREHVERLVNERQKR